MQVVVQDGGGLSLYLPLAGIIGDRSRQKRGRESVRVSSDNTPAAVPNQVVYRLGRAPEADKIGSLSGVNLDLSWKCEIFQRVDRRQKEP